MLEEGRDERRIELATHVLARDGFHAFELADEVAAVEIERELSESHRQGDPLRSNLLGLSRAVPALEALVERAQKIALETHATRENDRRLAMLSSHFRHAGQRRQHLAECLHSGKETDPVEGVRDESRHHLRRTAVVEVARASTEVALVAEESRDDVPARRAARVAKEREIVGVRARALVEVRELAESHGKCGRAQAVLLRKPGPYVRGERERADELRQAHPRTVASNGSCGNARCGNARAKAVRARLPRCSPSRSSWSRRCGGVVDHDARCFSRYVMGILRILALLTRPSARVRRVTAYRLRPVLAFVLACALLF